MTIEFESTIDSWLTFIDIAAEYRPNWTPPHFQTAYRGQPMDYGNLRPTLARIVPAMRPNKLIDAVTVERLMLNEIERRLHLVAVPGLSSVPGDRISLLVALRHYGAPARLLDWTLSPAVALYFACAEFRDKDGELWCVSAHGVNELDGGIQSTYLPPRKLKSWLDLQNPSAQRDPPQIAFFEPERHTVRSAAQQGLFSMSMDPRGDHAVRLATVGTELEKKHGQGWGRYGLKRYRVPSSRKEEFLEHLYLMNIHAIALFPDMEGLGKFGADICEMYLRGNHTRMEELVRSYSEQPPTDVDLLGDAESS